MSLFLIPFISSGSFLHLLALVDSSDIGLPVIGFDFSIFFGVMCYGFSGFDALMCWNLAIF